MKRLRNRIYRKILIFKEKIVDCKSAHAGSIPASASILKTPQIKVCGVFYWVLKSEVFHYFGHGVP